MLEYIVVGVIVGAVVLLGVRSIIRTVKGAAPSCACSSKGCCSSEQRCSEPQLTRIELP